MLTTDPGKLGEPLISLEISSVGELIEIGSGNPLSDELYTGSQHKAYLGRLLAIVRSTPQGGEITLKASMDGLPTAEIRLKAEQVGKKGSKTAVTEKG